MRLQILGDLHLEFGLADIPRLNVDGVILTGDVHLGREGCKWIWSHFHDTPVIYVLGNHEFYHHSIHELTQTLKQETAGSNIHVLENGTVELNGFQFLGCTLWTDFWIAGDQEDAMRTAESLMSDYGMIWNNSENRALRARDTVRLHRKSVAWLKEELAKGDPARTVIVTHHAPSGRSEAPYHAHSPLRAAFASDLDSFVERCGVPLWVHGHTHYNIDYKLGATRVLTNQRGYPGEPCHGFDPMLVVDVQNS